MKIRIGLASPRIAASLAEGIAKVKHFQAQAASQNVQIVCFPESYLPGLRGQDFTVPVTPQGALESALDEICQAAKEHRVTTIIGMDWETESGLQNVAFVISETGEVLGFQSKNQIAPEEDGLFVAGQGRQLFEANNTKFGIVICHEGWRYPESVRWAAVRGAKIVFHLTYTGSDKQGLTLTQWGAADSPYFEKALMCRSVENTIFFASVNYAMRFQEAATSIISPSGQCIAYLPYGTEGLLVQDLDLSEATGLIASRYRKESYA
jgi:predicted amidohydrolase